MEKSSAQLVSELMDRMKQTKKWHIIRQVPENFEFLGPAPFTISISSKGVMTFVVYAPTIEEAHQKVDDYLEPFAD